jgi:hypothetical protein
MPAMTALGVSLLVGAAGAAASLAAASAPEQPKVMLRDAPLLRFPGANAPEPAGETDCNSPAHWDDGTLYLFNSAGHPWRSAGPDLFHLTADRRRCAYDKEANGGRWIEATWKDGDGALYGWYHNEPGGVCPERKDAHLTAPRIGALRSNDNGATWHDLGVILEAPPGSLHCDTRNFYFAGGNGDFSVLLDARKQYFYFFFSAYGDFAEQGVAAARMKFADRNAPVGKVWKWRNGKWNEPGLGGHLTPVFPAAVDWHREDADAFWGPSIHWNTHLKLFVMLLNRAKDKDWTQEGLYVTFNRDLANPHGWTKPQRIMDAPFRPGWYPQVIGLETGGTDKRAGRVARLFVHGQSRWEIVFLRPGETP